MNFEKLEVSNVELFLLLSDSFMSCYEHLNRTVSLTHSQYMIHLVKLLDM